MEKYSISGDFGQVKIFDQCISSEQFVSVDRITQIGWHKVNDLYQIQRPNGFSTGLFLLTLSGKGRINICGKEYLPTAGDVVVIPKNCKHNYGAEYNKKWEFYWIHYFGNYADLCTKDIVSNGKYMFNVGIQAIEFMFQKYTNIQSDGIEREFDNSEWLRDICVLLLKKSVLSQYTFSEKNRVNDIIKFIEDSDNTSFSLDKLASNYHYSKEYIIRLLKKTTGMTPYRHWTLLKLKRSCTSLEKENKSIDEIAKEYGYTNASNYSNQFKKYYKMTPSEYRNLYKFGRN